MVTFFYFILKNLFLKISPSPHSYSSLHIATYLLIEIHLYLHNYILSTVTYRFYITIHLIYTSLDPSKFLKAFPTKLSHSSHHIALIALYIALLQL